MQKEAPKHPLKQWNPINLDSKQTMQQQLMAFSKSISQKCEKFTKQFFHLLNNEQMAVNLNQKYLNIYKTTFNYQKKITASPICAKVLFPKQYAFKCYNCQNEDNSIICIDCFNKSDHKDHNFQKIQVNGGCCDCGDDQKWKIQGSCESHNKKQINIDINEAQCEIFIREIQYPLYLLFLLNFGLGNNFKSHQVGLLQGFVNYLTQFNLQSMISNQMTFRLFKSHFSQNLPKASKAGKRFSLKLSVFSLLLKFSRQKQFSRKLVDLFIIMFTRVQFKKYLTCEYNLAILQKPEIITSQISNISCQIYTSHKIISQLIDQKAFPPIKITNLNANLRFQMISDIYARFFIDLNYLTNLYNNIGERYSLFHFKQGNVIDLSGYQRYVRNDYQDSVNYYGLQFILFYHRCTDFFKYLHKDPDVLMKAIRDVLEFLQNRDPSESLNLYISRERTLLILLFILFNGQIQKASNKQFLKSLKITWDLLFKILQAVLSVIRFYAINLANRQTIQRFYTFYAFCLGKKPRILISMDFQLVKFCLLAMDNLQHKVEQVQYDQQMNITYDQNQLSFQLNKMPLSNLLALPVKFIEQINKKGVRQDDQGAYDRKKALGFLTDYIGLMHEILISNNSQIILKSLFLKTEYQQVKILYGNLIKSIGSLKFEQLKQISKVFLGDQNQFLTRFVKQNCVIQNKKLKLKSEVQNNFESFNFSYLKSMKSCQVILPLIAQNLKQNSFSKIPHYINCEKQVGHQESNSKLANIIFNKSFIDQVIKNGRKYIQILEGHQKVFQVDNIIFSGFVQQLIRLNYTLNNPQINNFLGQVKQSGLLFKVLPQNVKQQIIKIIGVKMIDESQKVKQQKGNQVNMQSQQNKKRLQQLKAKKLQKMKLKQTKTLKNLTQSQQNSRGSLNEQVHECMFCKMSYQQQPLSILCFSQKSNLIFKNYLNCSRSVNLISSCYHLTHQSCINKVYVARQYTFCNYCKVSSNCLLKAHQKTQEQKTQMEQIHEDTDNKKKGNRKFNQNFFEMLMQQNITEQMVLPKDLELQQQQEQQDKDKQKLSELENKIQSITYSIMYGIVIDYQYFVKSLAKVCFFIFRDLATIPHIKIDQLILSLDDCIKNVQLNQNQAVYWVTYRFIIVSIVSLLGIERYSQDKNWNTRILQQRVPKQLFNNIIFILTSIKSIQSFHLLQQTKIQPVCPPTIKKLPLQLSQLAKQMGPCKSCGRITNENVICLLCQFKSCVGCQSKNLTNHVMQHGQASVFIRVDQGWALYVSKTKNRLFSPIYQNFMGEYFTLFKNQLDRSEYKLDMTAYNKIKSDLIRHRVEQQIRYQELKTGRTSILNP